MMLYRKWSSEPKNRRWPSRLNAASVSTVPLTANMGRFTVWSRVAPASVTVYTAAGLPWVPSVVSTRRPRVASTTGAVPMLLSLTDVHHAAQPRMWRVLKGVLWMESRHVAAGLVQLMLELLTAYVYVSRPVK